MRFVRFSGGLGNQLFNYAYLYAQLRDYRYRDLPIIIEEDHFSFEDERFLTIQNFNTSLNLQVGCKNIWERIGYQRYRVVKQIIDWCKKRFGWDYEKWFQTCEKYGIFVHMSTYSYSDRLSIRRRNFYLRGMFQSWRYFADCQNEIRQELQVITPPSEDNRRLLEEIRGCTAVCMHIRRGDYMNSHYAAALNICDYSYYRKALERICSKVADPIVYVFSNTHEDIEWIRENYDFGSVTVRYVDFNNPDYEELRLMSACKHFIISNSTFSWWAQFLGTAPDKIVVAPSVWNREEQGKTSDIYMPSWEIVDVG